MSYCHVTLEVYEFFELKTQRPGSVYYFRDWKPKDLEVYIIFVTENARTWKCIPFLYLITQQPGSVYYVRT